MAKPEETGVLSARVPLPFFNKVDEYLSKHDPEKGGRTRLLVAAVECFMGCMDRDVTIAERDLVTAERDALRLAVVKLENELKQFQSKEKKAKSQPVKGHAITSRNRQCQAVLDRLTIHPSTSYEIAQLFSDSTNNIARRITDLRDAGLVYDTGKRRKGERYMLTVWAAKDKEEK